MKHIINKVGISKYFSGSFPIENGLKQGDVLSSMAFRPQENYTG
jgi:hypothetical protein